MYRVRKDTDRHKKITPYLHDPFFYPDYFLPLSLKAAYDSVEDEQSQLAAMFPSSHGLSVIKIRTHGNTWEKKQNKADYQHESHYETLYNESE